MEASPAITSKQMQESQDAGGSEKTLPRHLEESASDVRILSPVPRHKKEEEEVRQTHEKLLTINSKH